MVKTRVKEIFEGQGPCSCANKAYIAISGHFTDRDWTLHEVHLQTLSFVESRTGANVAEKVDSALYDFAPSASRSAFVSDRPVVAIETLVGVPVRIFPQIFFRFFFLSFFKNANQFFFCFWLFLFLFYYYYYFLLKKERKEGENKETRW